jgi:membrane protein
VQVGTVAGTALWLLFAALFSVYINNFATPGRTYGALAGVAVLMIYIYGSSFILLMGAELNHVIEAYRLDDKRAGGTQQR